MFTGIIESIGTVHHLSYNNQCLELVVKAHTPLSDLKIGDSLAVNGVCLTITKSEDPYFHLTIVPETLKVTTLKFLKQNEYVNLERAMLVGARVGGHFVQGHVDTIGLITNKKNNGNAWLATIEVEKTWLKYIVKKGFITIDGMSITIVDVLDNSFTVTFIPHTNDTTKTHLYDINTMVNIEVDILSKTIDKLIGAYQK